MATALQLRRWSRVLQAGIAAEQIVYDERAVGGSDDRALLGRLWGLSGHDVDTAQREQRRARREVDIYSRIDLCTIVLFRHLFILDIQQQCYRIHVA